MLRKTLVSVRPAPGSVHPCRAIDRRAFIGKVFVGVLAAPLIASAQQPERMRRIGVLMGFPESDLEAQRFLAAFRDELHRLRWTEGSNVRFETRWATPGAADLMRQFAKELVALQPDLVLSHTTPTTTALLQQTRTIPIVFATVTDPVGSGFVASLARPGGNVTGFTVMEPKFIGKWPGMLKEIAPRTKRVACLFNPATTPYRDMYLNPLKAGAASIGLEMILAPVHDTPELEAVLAAQAREPNSALIVMPDSFTDSHRLEITSLAARYRLPGIYAYRFFAELGGLLSYGSELIDNFPRAATYADRILKGEKPVDLPVQTPNRYALTINLKTASTLGLTVPQSLLVRADEVIQ
jgi:putative ABC transport system substrate-binding protein